MDEIKKINNNLSGQIQPQSSSNFTILKGKYSKFLADMQKSETGNSVSRYEKELDFLNQLISEAEKEGDKSAVEEYEKKAQEIVDKISKMKIEILPAYTSPLLYRPAIYIEPDKNDGSKTEKIYALSKFVKVGDDGEEVPLFTKKEIKEFLKDDNLYNRILALTTIVTEDETGCEYPFFTNWQIKEIAKDENFEINDTTLERMQYLTKFKSYLYDGRECHFFSSTQDICSIASNENSFENAKKLLDISTENKTTEKNIPFFSAYSISQISQSNDKTEKALNLASFKDQKNGEIILSEDHIINIISKDDKYRNAVEILDLYKSTPNYEISDRTLERILDDNTKATKFIKILNLKNSNGNPIFRDTEVINSIISKVLNINNSSFQNLISEISEIEGKNEQGNIERIYSDKEIMELYELSNIYSEEQIIQIAKALYTDENGVTKGILDLNYCKNHILPQKYFDKLTRISELKYTNEKGIETNLISKELANFILTNWIEINDKTENFLRLIKKTETTDEDGKKIPVFTDEEIKRFPAIMNLDWTENDLKTIKELSKIKYTTTGGQEYAFFDISNYAHSKMHGYFPKSLSEEDISTIKRVIEITKAPSNKYYSYEINGEYILKHILANNVKINDEFEEKLEELINIKTLETNFLSPRSAFDAIINNIPKEDIIALSQLHCKYQGYNQEEIKTYTFYNDHIIELLGNKELLNPAIKLASLTYTDKEGNKYSYFNGSNIMSFFNHKYEYNEEVEANIKNILDCINEKDVPDVINDVGYKIFEFTKDNTKAQNLIEMLKSNNGDLKIAIQLAENTNEEISAIDKEKINKLMSFKTKVRNSDNTKNLFFPTEIAKLIKDEKTYEKVLRLASIRNINFPDENISLLGSFAIYNFSDKNLEIKEGIEERATKLQILAKEGKIPDIFASDIDGLSIEIINTPEKFENYVKLLQIKNPNEPEKWLLNLSTITKLCSTFNIDEEFIERITKLVEILTAKRDILYQEENKRELKCENNDDAIINILKDPKCLEKAEKLFELESITNDIKFNIKDLEKVINDEIVIDENVEKRINLLKTNNILENLSSSELIEIIKSDNRTNQAIKLFNLSTKIDNQKIRILDNSSILKLISEEKTLTEKQITNIHLLGSHLTQQKDGKSSCFFKPEEIIELINDENKVEKASLLASIRRLNFYAFSSEQIVKKLRETNEDETILDILYKEMDKNSRFNKYEYNLFGIPLEFFDEEKFNKLPENEKEMLVDIILKNDRYKKDYNKLHNSFPIAYERIKNILQLGDIVKNSRIIYEFTSTKKETFYSTSDIVYFVENKDKFENALLLPFLTDNNASNIFNAKKVIELLKNSNKNESIIDIIFNEINRNNELNTKKTEIEFCGVPILFYNEDEFNKITIQEKVSLIDKIIRNEKISEIRKDVLYNKFPQLHEFVENIAQLSSIYKNIPNDNDGNNILEPFFSSEQILHLYKEKNKVINAGILASLTNADNTHTLTSGKIVELIQNAKSTENAIDLLLKVIPKEELLDSKNKNYTICGIPTFFLNKENINELSQSEKRILIDVLIKNNANLFKYATNLGSNEFRIIPRTKEEYCSILPKLVKSIGIETVPISEKDKNKFLNEDIVQLADEVKKIDFEKLEITQSFTTADFINKIITAQQEYNISESEMRKVFDYFCFEIKEGKLYGYPANLQNGEKLKEIENENTKKFINEIVRDIVKQYSQNNKIKTNAGEKLDNILNDIAKIFPEIHTMVGKTQHKTHSYDVLIHSLKVLQGITTNIEYDKLSEDDKQVLILSSLLHDIRKKQGEIDKQHPQTSSFDAFFICEKLNLPVNVQSKIYDLIKNHDWLEKINRASNRKNEIENIAFQFRNTNMLQLATMFTAADLKAVNISGEFYEKHENSLKEISAEVKKLINDLQKTQPMLPNTIFPKASQVKDGIGVYRTADGVPILKLNEIIDFEAIGFPKGTTKDNVKFLVHALDYETQLANFNTFSSIDSEALLSTSYLIEPYTEHNVFRPQGVILECNTMDVHAGSNMDYGSGYKKTIEILKKEYIFGEKFRGNDRTFFSELVKVALGTTDEEKAELNKKFKENPRNSQEILEKEAQKITDEKYIEIIEKYQNMSFAQIQNEDPDFANELIKIFDIIENCNRSYGRSYNEVLVTRPHIQAVFMYDINKEISNPTEFISKTEPMSIQKQLVKFAKENDLPVIYFGD